MTQVPTLYPSIYPDAKVSIGSNVDGSVSVYVVGDSGKPAGVVVDRAAFLDAVSKELGVATPEMMPLPEVVIEDNDWYRVNGEFYHARDGARASEIAEEHEHHARNYRAIAAYIEANPPVDEAKVEELAALLREVVGVTDETIAAGATVPASSGETARRLLATGRIEVKDA